MSEGGFEPPRAMRPLGPQPSASTMFRHSDAMRILPTGRDGPAAYFHFQDSQNVDRPKRVAVMTVILSSRRSRAVPPLSVLVPPNMSESPLPRPE